MQNFLIKHYIPIMICALILLVGGAFYAGVLEGKSEKSSAIVLSCTENTLEALKVPVARLAEAQPRPTVSREALTASVTPLGKYVGSKNGTKYYGPTCSTVGRIKPENRVWFKSTEDATLQGYTAGKC